jgi:hypothetical protein
MHGPPVEEASHETTHQIEELVLAIQDLRQRVEALERGPAIAGLASAPGTEAPALADESTARELSSGLLASIGRVLLGIAGAYLLRAVTEAGILPHLAGTLAGIIYACAWLLHWRTSQDNRWAAPLHGLTASAILVPLLWEATIRFQTLTPSAAAAILALFIVLGQIIAWRRDSSSLAGIVALAGSAASIALIVGTFDPMPFCAALAIGAAVVEYGACRGRVLDTRWIIALTADFCAFLLVYLLTRPHGLPEGYAPIPVIAVFAIQWALVAVYLASTTIRTLARGLGMRWFEIGQLLTVVALAIGSTLRLVHGTDAATFGIGAGCLAAAAGCYAASAMAEARRQSRNCHAYAIFALLLALVAGRLLVTGLPLAALWSTLALGTTWFGERRGRNVLRVHGALYLAAAAVASGLMNWSPPTASAALMATFAALTYVLILRLRGVTTPEWPERVPSAIVAGLLCWSLVALTTGPWITSRLPAPLGSTLRTVAISAAAIVLAWLGSRRRLKELVWLLYPWMAFGAIKLILEDFSHGQSATLFVSLLVYGAALTALPRLLRPVTRPASPLPRSL